MKEMIPILIRIIIKVMKGMKISNDKKRINLILEKPRRILIRIII